MENSIDYKAYYISLCVAKRIIRAMPKEIYKRGYGQFLNYNDYGEWSFDTHAASQCINLNYPYPTKKEAIASIDREIDDQLPEFKGKKYPTPKKPEPQPEPVDDGLIHITEDSYSHGDAGRLLLGYVGDKIVINELVSMLHNPEVCKNIDTIDTINKDIITVNLKDGDKIQICNVLGELITTAK